MERKALREADPLPENATPDETFTSGLEINGRPILADEIADIIWLAAMVRERGRRAGQAAPLAAQPPAAEQSVPPLDLTIPESSTTEKEKTEANGDGKQAELHLPGGAFPFGSGVGRGFPLVAPGGSALPNKLAISRSLRPLVRRVPSLTAFTIDEPASAERTAEAGNLLTLVQRPIRRRWLDLALVIDESPSMAQWHRTLEEFIALLEQLAAFRTIRTWGMIAVKDGPAAQDIRLQLHATRGAGRTAGRLCAPEELLDARGERLILIATDCHSMAWESGLAAELLAIWGQQQPVTILQMLPRPLWQRTALAAELDVTLWARTPGAPNAHLEVASWPWYWSDEDRQPSSIPYPVITLEPHLLDAWARMVAGYSLARVFGYYFQSPGQASEGTQQPPQTVPESIVRERTVREQFNAVWRHLSESARELAAYLAATPISLPIIRLVQQVMQPGRAQQSHIAEIMYSGLLEPLTAYRATQHPDEIQYDFVGGDEMRSLWLDRVGRDQIETMFKHVTGYINAKAGKDQSIYSLLYAEAIEGEVELSTQSRAYANVAPVVLRHLGGVYEEIADRLEQNTSPVVARREGRIDGRPREKAVANEPPLEQLSAAPEKGETEKTAVPSQQQFFNGYALLIAVDENQMPTMALPVAARDATALRDVLTNPERCAYPPENVRLVMGNQATRAGIFAGLDWLREKVSTHASATAVVYYSGHGGQANDEYYLVPYDLNRAAGIAATALRVEDFADKIAQLQSNELLVILDCSHAGGIGIANATHRLGEVLSASIDAKSRGSKVVISAFREDQRANVRKDETMSVFAYHLLEALTGHYGPTEGATHIYASDLASYFSRQASPTGQLESLVQQVPVYEVIENVGGENFPVGLLLGGKGYSQEQPIPSSSQRPSKLRSDLQKALQAWYKTSGTPEDLLDYLLLVRERRQLPERHGSTASLRLATNEVLLAALNKLAQQNEGATQLLRWRFLDDETQLVVANRLGVSRSTISRLERTAIDQLADILYQRELSAREDDVQVVETRLSDEYSNLPRTRLPYAELQFLVHILANRESFMTHENRKALLMIAGVYDHLAENVNLDGSPYSVAASVIAQLKEYGETEEGDTALGRLLNYLVMDETLTHYARETIQRILRNYQLSEPEPRDRDTADQPLPESGSNQQAELRRLSLIAALDEQLSQVTSSSEKDGNAVVNRAEALVSELIQYFPDHPDTATSLSNLGNTLANLGQLERAIAFYQQALAIFEATLGPDHPDARRVREYLAALDRPL